MENMETPANRVRYISDGTFSIDQAWNALEAEGALVRQPSGEHKFVPDDPGLPTTIFRADGQVEIETDNFDMARVEEYIGRLSGWLGVALQPVLPKRQSMTRGG